MVCVSGAHLEGNGHRTAASAWLSQLIYEFSDVGCVAPAVVPALEPQGLEPFHKYNQTGASATQAAAACGCECSCGHRARGQAELGGQHVTDSSKDR